jgi:hypothetical protein
MMVRITRQIVESLRTEKGGFSRGPLAALGISWPLKHGWKKALIGTEIPGEVLERAFAIRDGWIRPDYIKKLKRY